MIGNRRSVAAAVAGAAALVTVLSGCAGGSTNSPTPTSVSATGSATTSNSATPTTNSTAVVAGTPYTESQVAQLCSDLDGQLQNWRTVTPTLGRGGLNTVVITWATQNGINLLDLAQNRASIDAATTAVCPQTRDGALIGLEIPDLASGLVGF
ncbi:hypothetical protein ABH922_002547 [Rhodococcus sp. 27YEA15]|uniref:hypothetical protein n=1 Tax=Rhodococcus sp. 27YEA15 TaxID=3156259 RepID=UPI003C7A155D